MHALFAHEMHAAKLPEIVRPGQQTHPTKHVRLQGDEVEILIVTREGVRRESLGLKLD